MREVRNCFPASSMRGTWTIAGGHLTPGDLLLPGDWIALEGSLYNDGAHQLDEHGDLPGARDETFTGVIWLLRPPGAFLELCAEIAAWEARWDTGALAQERLEGYGWRGATDANGLPVDWRDVFRARLIPYRRMFPEVNP